MEKTNRRTKLIHLADHHGRCLKLYPSYDNSMYNKQRVIPDFFEDFGKNHNSHGLLLIELECVMCASKRHSDTQFNRWRLRIDLDMNFFRLISKNWWKLWTERRKNGAKVLSFHIWILAFFFLKLIWTIRFDNYLFHIRFPSTWFR